MRRGLTKVLALVLTVALSGCSDTGPTGSDDARQGATTGALESPGAPVASSTDDQAEAEPRLPRGVSERPRWLGRRVLPPGRDGYGIATRTPPILRNRRLATHDFLPSPESSRFESSIRRVPKSVLRRSSWRPVCPVAAADLAYVTVAFWGFDGRPHTGELLVNRSVARDVVRVFEKLHRAGWPIEEMRITPRTELDAPPTGDGNNTGAFACRPSRTSSEWSEHAYGLAVDVNPFHNPYVRGDLVLPELALAYKNRAWKRPGMIRSGDVVTRAFDDIGWGWGGEWTSAKDWMHFSASGR